MLLLLPWKSLWDLAGRQARSGQRRRGQPSATQPGRARRRSPAMPRRAAHLDPSGTISTSPSSIVSSMGLCIMTSTMVTQCKLGINAFPHPGLKKLSQGYITLKQLDLDQVLYLQLSSDCLHWSSSSIPCSAAESSSPAVCCVARKVEEPGAHLAAAKPPPWTFCWGSSEERRGLGACM